MLYSVMSSDGNQIALKRLEVDSAQQVVLRADDVQALQDALGQGLGALAIFGPMALTKASHPSNQTPFILMRSLFVSAGLEERVPLSLPPSLPLPLSLCSDSICKPRDVQ